MENFKRLTRRHTMTATVRKAALKVGTSKSKAVASKPKAGASKPKDCEPATVTKPAIQNETRKLFYEMMSLQGGEVPTKIEFHGSEIITGLERKKNDKGFIVDHFVTELGSVHGYLTLQAGATKPPRKVTIVLRIHVVMGPVQLIINEESRTLPTGCMLTIPTGTKYSLHNNSKFDVVMFFYHQPNDVSSEDDV